MSHDDREKWKRSIKGKEYTPTRMDEYRYYTVEDNESQPPEERAELYSGGDTSSTPESAGANGAFLVRGATQVEEQTSLSDSSSDNGPGGKVYLDDNTPLDMAIEVAKHTFSRARTHAMRAILSARRLVQRIKKDRWNTVQATLTQMDIQHTPTEGTGTSQEQEARRHIQQGGRARSNEKTHERHGSGVDDCVTRGTASALLNMAVGHQIRSISGSPCDGAGIYEQYKRNFRVPGAGQVIQVTAAEAEEGKRKWKLWAAAGDSDSDVQSSMEEDEDDTARNLDEEMQDTIDNEEEEEVDSVASADSCHDADGDYMGSENEMGAEIINDQVQADRHTDWDGESRLNSVSESSSESKEDENERHEQWRASTRRKRLTASDIISNESDIEENGNEGDRDSSDSDDDSTDASDSSSSSSGAAAGISSNTRKRKGGATNNKQETRKGRQKRDCQGGKTKEERNTGRNRTRRANEDPGATPRATRQDSEKKKKEHSTEKNGTPATTKTKAKGRRQRRQIARRTLTKRVVYMGGARRKKCSLSG
jgi:hypothetical protein